MCSIRGAHLTRDSLQLKWTTSAYGATIDYKLIETAHANCNEIYSRFSNDDDDDDQLVSSARRVTIECSLDSEKNKQNRNTLSKATY